MSMMAPYGACLRLTNAVTGLLLVFLTLAQAQVHAQPRPIRILVLGDSLTAGYGLAQPDGFQAQMTAALRAQGHEVRLLDAAVSGDTTTGGRARLDWALGDDAGGGGADAALVELGANDGLRGTDPAVTEQNLAAILDALKARHIPVLLSGMYALPNLGQDYSEAFRAVFDQLGHRPGVLFDPFFLDGVAGNPALNQPDHIHPTAQGVSRIVARLLPLMDRLIAMVPPG